MSAFAPSPRSAFGFVAVLVAAFQAVTQPVRSVLTAMKNRREVAMLVNADPAMLRDLGLTPMDVDSALSEPLWRDPSARLVIWSIERRAAARAAAQENLALLGLGPVPHADARRASARC